MLIAGFPSYDFLWGYGLVEGNYRMADVEEMTNDGCGQEYFMVPNLE
jgi:hypothetical protein